MYSDHPEFIIDKTKGIPYWRYMDFYKFLELINTSSLYFPNTERLGDQHEGKIPRKINEFSFDVGRKIRDNNYTENHNEVVNKMRNKILISSWTANKTESFAMWKMYAKDRLGVAVKTNSARLKRAFGRCNEIVYVGEVRYFDDGNPIYKLGNPLYSFMTKHNYYEFESEVRCITVLPEEDTSTFKNIKVDLSELIEEVYISPFASKSGLEEIILFLMKKNNLNFKINVSGVNDTWL